METVLALVGSGGIVTLLGLLLQHRQKMAELTIEHAKTKLQLENVKNKKIPLEHHPLFSTLDEIEYFFMWSFTAGDLGRTMVIRELCVNKLRVWRNVILEHVNEGQQCYEECQSNNRGSCNKTENIFRKMLLDGLDGYSMLWETTNKVDIYGRRPYDDVSLETMRKFLPIFKQWHLSREEMVRLAAHDIPNCNMNGLCYDDWWDMLTVYMYAFTQMKYDAVNAMRSLNGHITGDKFFDVTIGPVEPRDKEVCDIV